MRLARRRHLREQLLQRRQAVRATRAPHEHAPICPAAHQISAARRERQSVDSVAVRSSHVCRRRCQSLPVEAGRCPFSRQRRRPRAESGAARRRLVGADVALDQLPQVDGDVDERVRLLRAPTRVRQHRRVVNLRWHDTPHCELVARVGRPHRQLRVDASGVETSGSVDALEQRPYRLVEEASVYVRDGVNPAHLERSKQADGAL
mmetsp:Transcript_22192/g.77798  ORF Transcript_22192/g.77798 Transcript_22192/m.77798 type:complete len:205 (+) Transcript_22192:1040-1654(+)